MFNADQKNRFIAESGFPENGAWMEIIFNSIEAEEKRLGKDIALMTAEEVGRAVGARDIMAATTTANRIPIVVRYKNWCAANGLEAVLIRSGDVHVDVSEGIRDTMVYSPSRLLEVLDLAFPDDGRKNTPRCVYRAYLWLSFSGLRSAEAADVRVPDVNLRKKLISYNNRWYRIFDQGLQDIRTACELKVFEKPSPKGGKPIVRPREDNDRVLRGWAHGTVQRSPEHYVRHTLRTIVQTAFDDAGLPGMSALKIRKSGIFYDMLERELKGLDVSVAFYTLACDDYELDHQGSEIKQQPMRKAVYRIKTMYEKDFLWWKQAFRDELTKEFGVDSIPGVE